MRIEKSSVEKSTELFAQHMLLSDRAGNFTGTQAPGTNIYMARRTIDQGLDTLDIGLPGTIGASVRVGNLDAEGHALVAKFAFSHPLHLLAVVTSKNYACIASKRNNSRSNNKMQALFDKKSKKFLHRSSCERRRGIV